MCVSLRKIIAFSLVMSLSMSVAFPLASLAQERTVAVVKKEAVTAFRAKSYDKAAALFQELYGQTSNANLLFNIGLCYAQLQNVPKAIEFLEKFLSRVPNSRAANKAQKMLSELKMGLTDEYVEVVIRTEPSEANVFLNERSGGMIGRTPYTLKLLPGSHVVIVDKEGYEGQTRTIGVSKDGAREIFFQLYPTNQMGAIKFMISERDADVMVNKRRIGRSPIREELRLPNGEHEVLVMKPGYTTWREKVNVKANESQVLQVDLLSDRALTSLDDSQAGENIWPYVTMGTGLLFAGGAAVLGAQAQSLHDKLEGRASQGVLVHPSDKSTGTTWVTWTNVLSAVGAVAITGGATWWYLGSGDKTAQSAQWSPSTSSPKESSAVYGGEL